MSNSMTVSKMSGFFVSTTWSCIYPQKVATTFQSSKVNLPKYFETYKNRCFTTYLDLFHRHYSLERNKKKSVATFSDNFQMKRTKKKSKQIGQEKVALTIMGAGVFARKLTSSNKVSELLDGAPPAPRWLFDYITVTSHVVGLSRTLIVSRSHRWPSQAKSKARDEPNIQNVPTTSKM